MSPLEEVGFLADVPIELEVELDRKIMRFGDVLKLVVGGVLRMTRSAGENIDILLNGSLIGYGEIVIIEDAMGIRVTDFKSEE